MIGTIEDDHIGLVDRAVIHELKDRNGPEPVSTLVDCPILGPGPEFEAAYFRALDQQLPVDCRDIQKLVGFFRDDPRRWIITSMIQEGENALPVKPRIEALTKFWAKVGDSLVGVPPGKLPLVWLQLVPSAAPPWWAFWARTQDPKRALHQRMSRLDGTRCFRPLGPVQRVHLERWLGHFKEKARDPRLKHLARIDPLPVINELCPFDNVNLPMRTVRLGLTPLFNHQPKDND